MIFTTQCPSCESTFPIDSAKVPDGGVYARCSDCSEVFLVVTPDPTESADDSLSDDLAAAPSTHEDVTEAEESVPAELAAAASEVEVDLDASVVVDEVAAVVDEPQAALDAVQSAEEGPRAGFGEAQAVVDEEPAVADQTAVEPSVPEASAATAAPPVFGKRDPNERAARLARVLVSDMIAYHPDRHRRSLEEGTLPQDFDEEIQKSWAEYVDQVGKDVAETTPFFRDALNQVLARGQDIF